MGNETELIARLRAGDERVFDEIFRARYPLLVRAAHAITRDRGSAEEIAQEVFLTLWRDRATFAPQGAIVGYLVRAARNRALNHVRHQRIETRDAALLSIPEARDASAPADAIAAEMRVAILQTLDELPARCREVFELSRNQGLRNSEIAERLGISVKAVEAQMGRALRTFRERLAPWL